MSRQVIFTAAACAIAACVLIATVILSPSVDPPPKSKLPILDPDARFNAGPDPSKTTDPTKQTITPSGVVDRYYVRRFNDAKKQLTILSGEKARPKPNGVVDIEKIIAQIHLIPGRRVVEITAPRGTLVAPDNAPESGTLTGGVIITLYESPENKLVDLGANSKDATLRLFLDEPVQFNLDLGTVESEGPVHLTTARVDFQGTGLNLVYNERRRRINRLEIMRGQSMRFNPKAGEQFKKPASDKEPKDTAVIADYYRAVLDTNVNVLASEAVIDTDKMEILFSLENRSEREEPVKDLGWVVPLDVFAVHRFASSNPGLSSSHRFTSTATTRFTDNDKIESDPTKARSMMIPSPQDVVIQWKGSLLMEPLDEKPAELTGPDDTMITLIDHVMIRSAKDETISAQRVEYLSSAARVSIFGETLSPAIIDSPQFGKLRIIELVINQNEGTGKITGPGAIIASQPAKDAVKDDRKLPPGLTLTWNEWADLRFHTKAPAVVNADDAISPAAKKNNNPTLNPVAKLDALKDAVFHGIVKVEHPQVDLQTDQLSIAMTQPVSGKQDPQEIKASGHVIASARGSKDQAPLDITTNDLTITFTPVPDATGKNKAQPTRLLATGDVKTKQGTRGLDAGTLDVALAPAAKTGEDKAAKDLTDRLTIRHLLAEKDVRITAESPRMLVTADKLDGDAVTGILQLFGTTEKPARVEREDDSLTGKHITLRESDQYVTVDGPGTAEFITAGAAAKPDAPAPPSQRLAIHWLSAMDFNNTTGLANFKGNVVARTDRGVDVTRFQSGDLVLLLDPIDPKAKKPDLKDLINAGEKIKPVVSEEAKDEEKKKPADKDKAPARNVRKMIATEKVVFEAEQWADRVDGKLGTRFRLTGPVLTFDNDTGKLIVTGAGTMQIEDYRAKDKAKEKPATDKPASAVAFVGQGVTLFLWESSLAIDANHNDVRMDKGVKMIQQPAIGSDIQMRCDQLIADFVSTGGLNSWLTGKAGEPKLDNVSAAGNLVILYQKQTLRGDQLYYTGNKQMAIISAEDGKMAELDTEQATLPARQFRWFLDKDRIVAEEPGAIRTKVGN